MIDENIIAISKDIRIANTMHSDFYKKNFYYKHSLENIFKHSWQFIAKKSEINSSIYPFYFLKGSLNEPLILTLKNKKYRILSNVCTHRASILCEHNNNADKVKCPYHGRTFDLGGNILNAPGFEKTKNFPQKKDNLHSYPFKKWKDFLFCSLNGSINIDAIFSDINKRLKGYPFEKIVLDNNSSNIYTLDAHWALYCENYLEGFHVPYIHKGLNKDIDLDTYKTILLENGVLQFTESKSSDKNNIMGSNIYAYYYWIYPNIMLNFYSWGISINIIEPLSINKTKIIFLSFPIKGSRQSEKSPSSLDVIEKEDQEIVKSVQKGVLSNTYKRGRYSPSHELGVHHFHRLISKSL